MDYSKATFNTSKKMSMLDIEHEADSIIESAYQRRKEIFDKIGYDLVESKKSFRRICKKSCENEICINLKKIEELRNNITELYKSSFDVPDIDKAVDLMVITQIQGEEFRKTLESKNLLEYVVGIRQVPPTSDEISQILIESIICAIGCTGTIIKMLTGDTTDPNFNRLEKYVSLNLINLITFKTVDKNSNTTPMVWLAVNAAVENMIPYNIQFDAEDFESPLAFLNSMKNFIEFINEHGLFPNKEYGFAKTLLESAIDGVERYNEQHTD